MPNTPGRRTYCYKFSFLARLAILPWGNCKTYSKVVLDGSFVYPKSDLCLKTMPMLSVSMTVVLKHQQEHRKHNAKCFLIIYPNTIVRVTSWIPLPLYLIGYLFVVLSWMGKIYSWYSGIITFLSIVLFNLSCNLNIRALIISCLCKHLGVLTLSVRACYYCWWHSGSHRWTRTLPIGPPRLNEQENGSLRPSPLVPTLLPT